MTIVRVAYLHVCKHCGQHGHVALPDDTVGNEVVTKRDALEEVDRLIERSQIATDEAVVLRAQIESSSLADRDNLLAEMLRTGKEICDKIKQHLLSALEEVGDGDTSKRTYH